MNMTEWLEPAIKNRIYEITLESSKDREIKESHDAFMRILHELNDTHSIGGILFELEELFHNNSITVIDYSYRSGFNDSLKIIETKCPHAHELPTPS